MKMHVFVLGVMLSCVMSPRAQCELSDFAGSGTDNYATVFIHHETGTRVYTSPSVHSANVTLNSDTQELTYNNLSFSVANTTLIEREQTGVVPGTFTTVTLQHTLELDPFLAFTSDVGPLGMRNLSGSRFLIDENRDGHLGGFGSLSISGVYTGEGPTESVVVPFTYMLPVEQDQQFPWSRLDVADYPESIFLGGPGGDSVFWGPAPDFYTGTVDGLPSQFSIERIGFAEYPGTTLRVPEPSTATLLLLCAIGGGFATWRCRFTS